MRSNAQPWIPLALALALAAAPAGARLCAIDPVPAATLLFPFFEVDLEACGGPGLTTVLTVRNATPRNTIAHVTLWSDWSVPLLNFDLYLTGFDVETFDLRQALCDSSLPVTGPTVSNHGAQSDPPPADGEFPTCDVLLPFVNPVIPPPVLARTRAGLTGQALPGTDTCAGANRGNNIARGYVTVDVARDCSLQFPNDSGYFQTVASFDNRLVGEYALFDGGAPDILDQSLPAVHLEADTAGSFFEPGDHTFYGRYLGGDASDRREPLPSVLAVRYESLAAAARLRVWREGTADASAVTCGQTPVGFPLPQRDLLVFDEQENPLAAPASLGTEVELLDLGALPGLANIGWIQLDGRHPGIAEVYGDDRAQVWATSWSRAFAGSSAALDPFVLRSNCPETRKVRVPRGQGGGR